MGSADVRAYSRNKRGIAGNLAWINFDRHALLNLFQKALGTFVADADEIRPQFADVANGTAVFQSSVVRDLGPSISSTIDQLDNITITNSGSDKELATPWYSDQILPFDITLTGANEYGAMCAAKIFGVELLNEGSGISIDDAVTEMSATFVARAVEPMSAVPSPFQTRAFRPLPCFGIIEKHYRQRGVYSAMSLYMNRLRCIFCGRACPPLPDLRTGPGQAPLTTSKTAPHDSAYPENCATEPCSSGALPIISGAGVYCPSCLLACLLPDEDQSLLVWFVRFVRRHGSGRWADRSDNLIRLHG